MERRKVTQASRLLYVSPTDGVHDRRFVDAWRASGYWVESMSSDRWGNPIAGAEGKVQDRIDQSLPDFVQVGPLCAPLVEEVLGWSGPILATSWGFDLLRDINTSREQRDRAQRLLLAASHVLVDSPATMDVAMSLGADPGAFTMFPWGVDLVRFAPTGPDLRASLRVGKSDVLIVSMRNLEPAYAVADLLAGFRTVRDRWPQTHLVFAGNGSQREELGRRASAMGLAESVTFVGALEPDDLARLLRSADIYVSTSPVDGSSVSLLEAMASGLPSCVTDIPGNRYWVDDLRGVRYRVGDVDDLAGALNLLVETCVQSPEVASSMGSAARRAVQEGADWALTQTRFPELAEAVVAPTRKAFDD